MLCLKHWLTIELCHSVNYVVLCKMWEVAYNKSDITIATLQALEVIEFHMSEPTRDKHAAVSEISLAFYNCHRLYVLEVKIVLIDAWSRFIGNGLTYEINAMVYSMSRSSELFM